MTSAGTLATPTFGTERLLDERAVRRALDSVMDPELDEPITDLGFVRSVRVGADRLEIHLRLPTSFCSPNFAYLMASDAKSAVQALGDGRPVVVELDDHHDSEVINRGMASDAGYVGTFGPEAESSLDELRSIFQRKGQIAAMERALTALLRESPIWSESEIHQVTIGDLPDVRTTRELLKRRTAIGFGVAPHDRVLVDADGNGVPAAQAIALLRRARSTRISVEGNAHFCRGLLATRYPGAETDQAPRAGDDGATRTSLPLLISAAPERKGR